jgi:sulfatase modifying factor 1
MKQFLSSWILFSIGLLITSCEPVHIPSSLDMVFVEGGEMKCGDGEQWPFHNVTIDSFYMSAYEITNAQLAEVYNWAKNKGYITVSSSTVRLVPNFTWELLDLDDKNCQFKLENDRLMPKPGKEDYPVVRISWFGAVAFCNFLSEKENRDLCYNLETWDFYFDKDGYRLPQADEWEYAARGGKKSRNTIYAGSNIAEEVAWYLNNAQGTVHPVGLKKPNELGIFDLSGNVREFCTEKMGFYWATKNNPSDAMEIQQGSLRIYRGGSFATDRIKVSSFVNNINYPDYCYGFNDLGFRVVSKINYQAAK